MLAKLQLYLILLSLSHPARSELSLAVFETLSVLQLGLWLASRAAAWKLFSNSESLPERINTSDALDNDGLRLRFPLRLRVNGQTIAECRFIAAGLKKTPSWLCWEMQRQRDFPEGGGLSLEDLQRIPELHLVERFSKQMRSARSAAFNSLQCVFRPLHAARRH